MRKSEITSLESKTKKELIKIILEMDKQFKELEKITFSNDERLLKIEAFIKETEEIEKITLHVFEHLKADLKADLKLAYISEDTNNYYFKMILNDAENDNPIAVKYDKAAKQHFVEINDLVRAYGYANIHAYLSTDAGLEFISRCKKERPGMPLFGKLNDGAIFENKDLKKTNSF